MLVAHVDLMTAPTKEKLAEKLAKTIHEDIASVVFRAREAALEVFRGLRVTPTITIDPNDASVSFGFETGRASKDVDETLERLLSCPASWGQTVAGKSRSCSTSSRRSWTSTRTCRSSMRAVFQTQPEVAHVYLGSRRHMMRRIFSDENEPFWRSAKQMELGVIPPALFAPFIGERFPPPAGGSTTAVALILAITRGPPVRDAGALLLHVEGDAAAGARDREYRRRRSRGGFALGARALHAALGGLSAGQRVLLEALARSPGRP